MNFLQKIVLGGLLLASPLFAQNGGGSGGHGGAKGAVNQVNGINPNASGNVVVTAASVKAIPADGSTPVPIAQIPNNIPPSKIQGAVPFASGTQQLSAGSYTLTISSTLFPSGISSCVATVIGSTTPVTVSGNPSGNSQTFTGNNADYFNYLCTGNTGAAPPTPTTTTTALTSTASSVTQGTSVTFNAAISPSSGPTGNVTFKDSGTTLTSVAVSNGAASYTNNSFATGSHSITATYSGDSNYSTSNSSAVALTVTNPPATGIAYVKGCSANPCTFNALSSSLVMLATINGNNTAATLTDSAGGTMPSEVSGWPKAVNGGQYFQHLWAVPNLTGNHSFTVTYGSEYYSQTSGSAFSGASTTSPIDAITYNASGYTPQCAAVTPTASTDMLASVVTGTSTPFSSTNMTNPTDNGSGNEVTLAYKGATGVSAFTPAWNLSGGAGDFGCASIAIH